MAATSVTRLQLALNSEDHDVVISELQALKSSLLNEHHALGAYGYHGRCVAPLTPEHPLDLVGILDVYLQRSPRLEELFSLWHLADRQENRALLAALADVVAVVLFCATSRPSLCATIVQRVLRELIRSIHTHLNSGHTGLIHSMLGLLIEISRVSEQSSRDLYQKLVLSSQGFTAISQKGKRIKSELQGVEIETDSRCLLIILLSTILLKGNDTIANELLPRGSLFRRALGSIGTYKSPEVKLILHCVHFIIEKAALTKVVKLNFMDALFLDKLLPLYLGEEETRQAVHDFMLFFCQTLASELHNKRDFAGLASLIVSKLTPYSVLSQRDVYTCPIGKQFTYF